MTTAPGNPAPTPPAEPAERARLLRTVNRDLVHRRSVAEVYVTDFARQDDQFLVWAQWPRSHPVYCVDGRYHPTLLLETMRQAVLTVCHGLLDVPHGYRFVMSRITADGLDGLPSIGQTPTEVLLRLERTEGPGRRRSTWTMDISVGAHAKVAGGGTLAVLTDAQYARLRVGHADRIRPAVSNSGADPARVGRPRGEVCLADTSGGFELHIDQGHPVFYDHPLDHVPGALLLESAIQRVHAHRPGHRLQAIDARFDSFIEPDVRCAVTCCETSSSDAARLAVGFHQGESLKTTATLTVTRPRVAEPAVT